MTAFTDAIDAFALDGQALLAALLASANDPADAVRLLLPLAGWMPEPATGTGPLADEMRAAQAAIASNLRCAACAALASAAQAYQPLSYQDAMALRAAVCAALDAEATRAGDALLDETYAALRNLRAAVSLDLGVRGANLAALVEIDTTASLPSLVAAWTLYQDTTREPQLVSSAAPANPLFLPLAYHALSR